MTCSICCSDHLPTVTMIFTARLLLGHKFKFVWCSVAGISKRMSQRVRNIFGVMRFKLKGYMEITKSFCWIQGLLVECGLGPTSDFRVIISWISPCRFQIWDLHWFGWTLSDLTIPDLKWATRCKFLVPSTHAQQTADTSTNFVAKLVPELLLPQWNDRGPMHSWGVFKTLHWWLSLG